MTAADQIHAWCQEVVERKTDVVTLVDHLLVLVTELGELRCIQPRSDSLRFEIGNPPVVVEESLRWARACLRMMCARLAVLVGETDGQEFQVYGGAGFITRSVPSQNGQAVERRFHMRHQNSNAAPIEVTITAL